MKISIIIILVVLLNLTSLVVSQANLTLAITVTVFNGTNCTAAAVCNTNGLTFFNNYTTTYSYNAANTNLCINWYTTNTDLTGTVGMSSATPSQAIVTAAAGSWNTTVLALCNPTVNPTMSVVMYSGVNCTAGLNVTNAAVGTPLPINSYFPVVQTTPSLNYTEMITCTTYVGAERIFLNFIFMIFLSVLLI